jgi:6-pyruvoyltetrahydropterin/6-carboxytetrahydropterin synthase
MDMKILKKIIRTEIEDCFDHKNLNEEVVEFNKNGLNPTAENISVVIFNKLRSKIEKKFDLEITLYETPRNFVTYSG